MSCIHKALRWWFVPAQHIDAMRKHERNTEAVADFRAAVWKRIGACDKRDNASWHQFHQVAKRMKWEREWIGLYLRSESLKWLWRATLTVQMFPFVAAPFALIWWISEHLTVTISWSWL